MKKETIIWWCYIFRWQSSAAFWVHPEPGISRGCGANRGTSDQNRKCRCHLILC